MNSQAIYEDDPAAIVETVEDARAEEVKRRINKLIKATNVNTFDLAELLAEAKQKGFYTKWGFPTYSQYAKSLEIKYAKAYYLVDIVETMRAAGVLRSEYEGVGLGKLRIIAELEPEDEYKGVPVVTLINELTKKAGQMSTEEVRAEVDRIKGKTADESMVWLNFHLMKLARENTVKPALALMKKHIGSVGQDEEGNSLDASDGRCLEMICANFLADPNYNNEMSNSERRQHIEVLIQSLLAQLKAIPVDPTETTTDDQDQ